MDDILRVGIQVRNDFFHSRMAVKISTGFVKGRPRDAKQHRPPRLHEYVRTDSSAALYRRSTVRLANRAAFGRFPAPARPVLQNRVLRQVRSGYSRAYIRDRNRSTCHPEVQQVCRATLSSVRVYLRIVCRSRRRTACHRRTATRGRRMRCGLRCGRECPIPRTPGLIPKSESVAFR